MATTDLTPYSTIQPFFGPLQTWLTAEDAMRIQAYQLYEGMYDNVPDTFKLVQRGSDANPIYIPSAKTLIEAKNRFLCKRWNYAMDPKLGTDGDRATLDSMLTTIFRREQVYAKFATQKRYGLIRGDAVWHIVADENKDPGKRISVYEVDPAAYFPIEDPWNPEKILGVHLVEPVVVDATSGKTVIKRQTYRKTDAGTISYELSWWELGGWDDRMDSGQTLKKATEIPEGDANRPVAFELDSQITAIPVYHIKNSRTPGASFGSSELKGLERIIQGINQAISDEELSLVLEGLGLYKTTSGPPVDENEQETEWHIGPGWVLEIDPDSEFDRVNGVGSVTPMQDHLKYLESKMRESSGVPDIAIGNVDVQTAESGIALAFKMAPIVTGNEEKEQEILSVMDHMLYDLGTMWLPVYEGLPVVPAQAVSVVDDPLPVNRAAVIAELVQLLSTTPPVITTQYAQQVLTEKLGYEFAGDAFDQVVAEAQAIAQAQDPFGARINNELAQAQQ